MTLTLNDELSGVNPLFMDTAPMIKQERMEKLLEIVIKKE